MPNDIGYGTGFRLAAAPLANSNALAPSTALESDIKSHIEHIHSARQRNDEANSTAINSAKNKKAGPAIFGGPISADQEVWKTVYPASGTARLVLNADQTAINYKFRIKGLDFGELAGIGPITKATGDDVNGMHIHHSPPGSVGDPVIGIINPNQDEDLRYQYNDKTNYWTITGRWSKEDPSIASFDYNLKEYLFQGLDYLNIHNEDVALGVIRLPVLPSEQSSKGRLLL